MELIGVSSRLSPSSRVAGHVLAHLTYSATLSSGTQLSFSVHNLFDRRYADPASFEIRGHSLLQDGRSLRVKLTHRF